MTASATVSGNFAAGIFNMAGKRDVRIYNTAVVFGNSPDYLGVRPPLSSYF